MYIRHISQIRSLLPLKVSILRLSPASCTACLVALWTKHLIASVSILDSNIFSLFLSHLLILNGALLS